MRYIRTKDGIYATDYHNDEMGYFITLDYDDYKDTEIIKQANTIKELCDRFVVIYENEEPVPYKNYLNAIATKKEIFGAIWTDKGLIYVAKMNDKGELELL